MRIQVTISGALSIVVAVMLAFLALIAASCARNGQEGTGPARVETPTPSSGLPRPAWLPPALSDEPIGPRHFVVEPATGEMWQIGTAESSDPLEVQTVLVAWSSAEEALVSVTDGERSALYVGSPGMSFRLLADLDASVTTAAWSPDGNSVALAGSANAVLVLDAASGSVVAELSEQYGSVVGWSNDSRYVAFGVGPLDAREVLVRERETGHTERIPTWSGVWSNEGARFAYGPPREPGRSGAEPLDVRVRSFDEGTDTRIAAILSRRPEPVAWSADDRFLAVSLFDAHDTVVVDLDRDAQGVLIQGAEPHGWLGDGDTLLMTGNSCGDSDIMTFTAGAGNLQNYTNTSEIDMYARPSRDGLLALFETLGNGESDIRLLNVPTGEVRDLASGPALSLFQNSIPAEVVWSPGARYAAFGITGGYDFCTGTEPQTTSVEFLP